MAATFVLPDGRVLTTPTAEGETLASAAARAGIDIIQPCGGRGLCRRCRLELREGRVTGAKGDDIVPPGGSPRTLCACRHAVGAEPVTIGVPAASLPARQTRMEVDFSTPPPAVDRPVRIEPLPPAGPGTVGHTISESESVEQALAPPPEEPPVWSLTAARDLASAVRTGAPSAPSVWMLDDGPGPARAMRVAAADRRPLGLAVDIGTTTVIARLVDLATGDTRARASRYNHQFLRGEDVASRITYSTTSSGLADLQDLVVRQTLNPLVAEVAERAAADPADILRVAVSGNTVMMHLLAGVSPESIGVVPFTPVFRDLPALTASALGLAAHPDAVVEAAPALSAYVGGDIASDLHVAGVLGCPRRTLLIDIGTNGEIAWWDGGRLRVSATAAGPAFEGGGVVCGMRADAGAIERLTWTGRDWDARTIGDAAAVGVCGSGLIDALAEMARNGFVNAMGRFDVRRLKHLGLYGLRERRGHPLHACRVSPASPGGDDPLCLTEVDVAELMKAKAALQAGTLCLLKACGASPADVDRLVLAGGFARHIDLDRAMAIGLLPRVPAERIDIIGNGSLAGACTLLLDSRARDGMKRLQDIAQPVELNRHPDFESDYIDALPLPVSGET